MRFSSVLASLAALAVGVRGSAVDCYFVVRLDGAPENSYPMYLSHDGNVKTMGEYGTTCSTTTWYMGFFGGIFLSDFGSSNLKFYYYSNGVEIPYWVTISDEDWAQCTGDTVVTVDYVWAPGG